MEVLLRAIEIVESQDSKQVEIGIDHDTNKLWEHIIQKQCVLPVESNSANETTGDQPIRTQTSKSKHPEWRKGTHSLLEKKRRDRLRKQLREMQNLLPSDQKLKCNMEAVKAAVAYIKELSTEHQMQEEKLHKLRLDYLAKLKELGESLKEMSTMPSIATSSQLVEQIKKKINLSPEAKFLNYKKEAELIDLTDSKEGKSLEEGEVTGKVVPYVAPAKESNCNERKRKAPRNDQNVDQWITLPKRPETVFKIGAYQNDFQPPPKQRKSGLRLQTTQEQPLNLKVKTKGALEIVPKATPASSPEPPKLINTIASTSEVKKNLAMASKHVKIFLLEKGTKITLHNTSVRAILLRKGSTSK